MDQRFTPLTWLAQAGYPAYLVGNQSRNRVLGIKADPHDIDIATSALPHQMVALLRRHEVAPIQVNETFGVIAFRWASDLYEVATFRTDIYDDQFDHIKRAPKQIVFIDDLNQDAQRRDFTINAIYWNPLTNKWHDPVDGRVDLKQKKLRFIGDADIRIKEDPLRLLRAIRFKYELGLNYDAKASAAIRRNAKLVHQLPPSIFKRELRKLQDLPNYQLAKRELQRLSIIGKF